MSIGDWVLKTWQNGVDVLNATNMQRFEDKINELDNNLVPKYLIKSADQIQSNNTVIQNDDDFTFTLDANSTYEIDLNLDVKTHASADFKSCWSKGVGITFLKRFINGSGTSTVTDNYNSTYDNVISAYNTEIISGGATDWSYKLNEKILITTGSSGNTLTFRWAQNSAQVYNTTVYQNSYAKITKMVSI